MTIANEGVIFGQRLRELRLARKLTQTQLAERCDSSYPFISNLERGVKVPSLTMVLRLAEAPRPADAADALALAICQIWRGGATSRLAAAIAAGGRAR